MDALITAFSKIAEVLEVSIVLLGPSTDSLVHGSRLDGNLIVLKLFDAVHVLEVLNGGHLLLQAFRVVEL